MISPLLRLLSVPVFSGWLLFILSPAQTSVPPSENVRQPENNSIARQEQEPGETILYFPDYVDGGGWSVQLVLSNVDPEAEAEVQVDVYDPDGQPVLDLFDSDLTLEIPSLGSRVLRSAGGGTIRRGWIEVQTRSAAVSGLLTYRDTQSGIEVGVKPVALGQEFALFVEESPTVGAGVAVYKPDAAARVELRIRDEEGHDPMEGGVVRWGDFRQAARTLPEWFAGEGIDTEFLRDFRGLLFLETEDESPFAPLGLRFGKGTSSLSAVPAIRTQSQEPQEAALVFPDYVDGGGWSVQLVLSNVDPEEAADVRVDVYDPDGQPVLDLFDSDLTLEIPSLGSRVLRSAGSGAIRRGWIQVQTGAATVGGLLSYRDVQSRVEVGVEPVQLGHEFALFVEESGTIGAGLALFKPDVSSRIELRLRDEEGNDPLEGVFLPWRDFHQAARTLPEWFDVPGVDTGFLADFRGLLFLRTENDSRFAPLGLRFGKGTSSLSAVPAIRITEGGGIDGGHPPPPTVTLSASPKSIDRGQSTTLSWSSTSAESAEIEPGIGEVPTSGTRRVSPNVTTTYRITVTGADGQTATASVTVTVAVSEREALRALFDALGGSGWSHSNNWLTDTPLGDWYGVEVDSQGRVIGLRMAVWVDTEDGGSEKLGNGLTGSIPPELGNLARLRELDLSRNYLTGSIPPELGNLARLRELDLSRNNLTGPIPPELGDLTNLERLQLSQNRLAGQIPSELGQLTKLTLLSISGNNLRGQIPSELGNLTKLTSLRLRENLLRGSIPKQLGSLANLRFLSLSTNVLTGEIPSELGNLTKLTQLELARNVLTGSVPGWLGSLTNLGYLNLQDNQLTGEIPSELGNLTKLFGLYLDNNHLTGGIPTELGNLENLKNLIFINNALVGPMPLSLMSLDLTALGCFSGNPGLCAAGTEEFRSWLSEVTVLGIQPSPDFFCDILDRNALVQLYETADGPAWSSHEGWLRGTPLDQWTGVRTDSIGRVVEVDLQGNGLSGTLPSGLGHLSSMTRLWIGDNALAGRLPESLMALPLEELDFGGTSLCVPDNPGFRAWLDDIPSVRGNTGNACAPLTERDILVSVFEGTGGAESWRRKNNWLSDRPLGSWDGVEMAADGSVVALDLCDNDLAGTIPSEIGELHRLTSLRICANRSLSGPIPETIGQLTGLTSLYLAGNNLSGPIPETIGHLEELSRLDLSGNALSDRIPDEIGGLQKLETLDLSFNELQGGIPPSIGRLDSLTSIRLGWNVLTGVPGEIGDLRDLRILDLEANPVVALPREIARLKRLEQLNLTGALLTRIPDEIGELESLRKLELRGSKTLTGGVPTQIGLLDNLEMLRLSDNSLTGPVPEAIGELSRLKFLDLSGNELTGPVPATMGSGGHLEMLRLDDNGLSGGIPASLGESRGMVTLTAGRNPEMSGPLPPELTNLEELRLLHLGGTDLCTPPDPSFQRWLKGVDTAYVAKCLELGTAAAYAMQAVQSFRHPVPLVAGDSAMVRVFLTAQSGETVAMPAVQAVFHREGREVYTADTGTGQGTVPSTIDEGSLSGSQMIEVPGWVVRPGTEMVIDVDPDGNLEAGLDIPRRIPAEGRRPLDVRPVPAFDLTVVPFLWTDDPDYSTAERVERMNPDDPLLWKTRTLLPIEDAAMNVTVHSRVWTSFDPTPEASAQLLQELEALRVAEGGAGHYWGVLRGDGRGGRANLPGWNSVSTLHEDVIAHELGHNLSLRHAPCDLPPWDPGNPSYPYPDGRIGGSGFDSREGRLLPALTPDIMGYCQSQWIGDYHFTKALRYRLHSAASGGQSSLVAAVAKSLLLWGGVDAVGAPFLEPAFVVEAPASLPRSTGEYEIVGRTADGDELFSLPFQMPEVADGDGSSSFAFVLPVQPEWPESLASITLSGHGGSATLDDKTDRPVTILRNSRTGQIRGILRDGPAAGLARDDAVSALPREPDMEALNSRGIPDSEDWTR